MSNHLGVSAPDPEKTIVNPIPVPLATPAWATKTFASDGYVMHEGQWETAFTGWTVDNDVPVLARVVGADELILREDGSIVADREEEVQLKIGDKLIFLKPTDLAQLITTLTRMQRDLV